MAPRPEKQTPSVEKAPPTPTLLYETFVGQSTAATSPKTPSVESFRDVLSGALLKMTALRDGAGPAPQRISSSGLMGLTAGARASESIRRVLDSSQPAHMHHPLDQSVSTEHVRPTPFLIEVMNIVEEKTDSIYRASPLLAAGVLFGLFFCLFGMMFFLATSCRSIASRRRGGRGSARLLHEGGVPSKSPKRRNSLPRSGQSGGETQPLEMPAGALGLPPVAPSVWRIGRKSRRKRRSKSSSPDRRVSADRLSSGSVGVIDITPCSPVAEESDSDSLWGDEETEENSWLLDEDLASSAADISAPSSRPHSATGGEPPPPPAMGFPRGTRPQSAPPEVEGLSTPTCCRSV